MAQGPFTLSLTMTILKSDSLVIAMLAKEMAYPTHSLAKSSVKMSFSTGITIAKRFTRVSVNGPLIIFSFHFLGIAIAKSSM